MAQNTPNTPSQPQQTEDPAWKSVSVTLISSDNGEFYVESLLLYAASSVFRSKGRPTISPPLRIKLTDPEFETAAVLSTFIEMLRHGKVELPDEDKQPGRPALNLFRFLKKYECRVHLQLFCNWLKLKGDNRPLSAFIVAALVDDHAWCAKLLQSGPMGTWPTLKTTKKAPAKSLPNPANCPAFHEGQADMSLLDPNGAPAWLWRTLPDDYKFALGRSWSACSTWEEPKRGEYFEYYLLGYRNEQGKGSELEHNTVRPPAKVQEFSTAS